MKTIHKAPAFVKLTRSKSYTRKPSHAHGLLGKDCENGYSTKSYLQIQWNLHQNSMINLKLILEFNLRPDALNQIQDRPGNRLQFIGTAQDFLNRTQNRISWNQKVSVQQKPPSFEWRGSLQKGIIFLIVDLWQRVGTLNIYTQKLNTKTNTMHCGRKDKTLRARGGGWTQENGIFQTQKGSCMQELTGFNSMHKPHADQCQQGRGGRHQVLPSQGTIWERDRFLLKRKYCSWAIEMAQLEEYLSHKHEDLSSNLRTHIKKSVRCS